MNWFLLGYLLTGALFAGSVLWTLGEDPGDDLYKRNMAALALLVAISVLGWPIYVAVAIFRAPRR